MGHASTQPLGYSTTGRMSVHQQHSASTSHQAQNQGPVSFTRALEITETIQTSAGSKSQNSGNNSQGATEGGSQDNQKRDSVYDVNNYEISV